MFTDETELKSEVRSFTQYPQMVLSEDGLDTAYRNAKRKIRRSKSLPFDYVWFNEENVAAQDALYWWTCIFTKVETGELDSQDLQAGGVDMGSLLAQDDESVTTWYREARDALQSMKADSIVQSVAVSRSGRAYSPGNFEDQNGGGTGGGGGGSGGNDINTNL